MLPILSCVTMWEKLHLQIALVCNYNDGTDLFSTSIGDKTTASVRILYAGIFLFFYTNRSFDLVNSALGVNTETNGTHSGCNPALGQKHAVWISSTPTSQPKHRRSQWGLASPKPPSSSTPNILLLQDLRKPKKDNCQQQGDLQSWKLCCNICTHNAEKLGLSNNILFWWS